MVAKEAVGAVGAPYEMLVERGKIDEFARAVLSANPAHLTGERPVIPPTFLTTTMFWEKRVPGAKCWSLVNMDQRRGVHAEEEIVFHGPPPRAGDRLTCQSRIDAIWEKSGRAGGTLTFVRMVTSFRDAAGQLVAETIRTGVETSQPPVDP
jgi:hypothetical protein